jgi:RNA polymerase sigma factor (sigma-70 family)
MEDESEQAILEAIKLLPTPHDVIIRRMYLDGQPLAEVARELRLSPQRVQYLHSRALRMLRCHLGSGR